VVFQQRDAQFYGVELGAQLDLGRVWRGVWGIDGQYDFVRATFEDQAGGNVPRMPPHRAGAGLFYRDSNWSARVGFLHALDQDQIGEGETPTKGYTLLNADLAL
jgi:iron complex outermembrane recepter protein